MLRTHTSLDWEVSFFIRDLDSALDIQSLFSMIEW